MKIPEALVNFFSVKKSRADNRLDEENPTGVREKRVADTFHDTITKSAAAENKQVEVEIWKND